VIAEAVLCLALNVYHEARGEPWDGRVAVALVVRNRAEKNGTSICWEVFRDGQMSWTNDMRNLRTLPAGAAWDQALAVARTVAGGTIDFTNGATYYHTRDMHPRWARAMRRVGVWGAHVFYRES